MPPKSKAAPKQKEQDSKPQDIEPPRTVYERSARVYVQGSPYALSLSSGGPSGLSPAERTLWTNAHFARTPTLLKRLGNKAQKDVWKCVNEASGLPLRAVDPPRPTKGSGKAAIQIGSEGHSAEFNWGRDRFGEDLGDYHPEQLSQRTERALQLAALEVQHGAFSDKRERERGKWVDPETKEVVTVTPDEIEEEKLRRKEIARLRMDLYGERTGAYGSNPIWDDIVPMPVEDSDGALAAIAYPEDYAEAISYLRAVMAKKEHSTRCLRLTEDIISMNPAHYTVWLYRFSIVQAMQIPIPEEIEWLNQVSLENLKNYQIWHHRRLLMDYYYPEIESKPEEKARLAKSEQDFLAQILAEDTKNYHVWSYRQYLVPKLGVFGESEIKAAESLVDEDVRNNSAWSHRFFTVFSDPAHTTACSLSTEYDPKVPAEIIDREVKYAQDKILLAPQNQSPWNYLRGVLVKGGRKMGSVEDFVQQFASDVGVDGEEKVTSTHGLELLAEIYAEKGENDKADLCLRRLGEKWDRIRLGYWQWRRQLLKNGEAA
ncbi:Protein farnesyltransferase/geranylgeranyltransferase type-1 subunit alpha [Cytospora mali]|uniref:Protein farnesyltransferase/geranylgeranyltransferase type-1 subunit alpha n=1 Tax=Cytospora mali TaxID=578113 RepID=A0A194W5E9_CYTMA|nr:Protein farnesyltransferase/geranylgeranyltransferase type-1 subunit alpha [Valsa mali]